jgi:hypothetical protein
MTRGAVLIVFVAPDSKLSAVGDIELGAADTLHATHRAMILEASVF